MLALVSFLVLILHNCDNFVVVSSLNDEGIALLSFKQSITQDPEGSLNNWNNSDETPCSWNGITCGEQKVVSISISMKKLSGFLSSSLGSLSQLRHLNLRNNNFIGSLPIELFNIQRLQSLVLYGNSFSGILPFNVGNLQYLQTLDLSHNFFNGSLPKSLVQCKRLKNLVFSHNSFSGSLPNEFGKNLVLLETLDLSYNYFDDSIPDDLGYLSNLQGTFDLSHNMFSGSIPPGFDNLPEKIYIDLSYNNLTGPIPHNGALINRGPTAFIGNIGLCGRPLKNLCSYDSQASSPSSFPYFPKNGESLEKVDGKGLSKAALIALIIVSDLIGICVVGLLFSFCYSKVCSYVKRKDGIGYGFGKGGKKGNECLCFRKDESETLSENLEHYELVALDAEVAFDLDELLKAAAFVLGKSGIGIVYKVVLEDGLTLAVRRLGEGGSQRFKEFQTEVEAIGKLRHQNIVTLRAYYWSLDEKLLIYDFVPKGNLATAIHGKPGMVKFTPLSWSKRLKIMKGVTRGLVYLHEYSPKKYVHGDLKPSKILLGHDLEPKISDFGLGHLANIAGGTSDVQSNQTVSDQQQQRQMSSFGSCYRAPEAVKVAKPSQKWDVYSFGIILLEIITGKSPLVRVGTSEMDLVRWMQICIEEKKPLCDVLDPYLVQEGDEEEEMMAVLKIAMACSHSSPDRRPLMRHVYDALERLAIAI